MGFEEACLCLGLLLPCVGLLIKQKKFTPDMNGSQPSRKTLGRSCVQMATQVYQQLVLQSLAPKLLKKVLSLPFCSVLVKTAVDKWPFESKGRWHLLLRIHSKEKSLTHSVLGEELRFRDGSCGCLTGFVLGLVEDG